MKILNGPEPLGEEVPVTFGRGGVPERSEMSQVTLNLPHIFLIPGHSDSDDSPIDRGVIFVLTL